MAKRNNSSWCCDKLEEKLTEYKKELKQLENTVHYEDSDLAFGRQLQLQEIINDLEEILYR